MGDRTQVTLTLQRQHAEAIRQEPWFDDSDEEHDLGIPTTVGASRRSLTDRTARVAFVYDEVNPTALAELGFLDELRQRGIPYDYEWEAGGDYPAGRETCRYTEDGELQRIVLESGEENPPIGSLMEYVNRGDLEGLADFLRGFRDATTPLTWADQARNGKRYLAKQLLKPSTTRRVDS